jgi:DNA repair exonuclease SbcCD ATPase subunit
MADQQKIKKIETVLQGNTAKAEDRVRELTDALDAERRKSMVDEKRVKDIERALNEKIYFLNELTRRKSEDEQELNALREEIQKERNKSMAD